MENRFHVNADEFRNKRVLVTGGTKGAGEAIVHRFLLSRGGASRHGSPIAVARRSTANAFRAD